MKNINFEALNTDQPDMHEILVSYSPEAVKIFNQLPDYLKDELEELFKHNPYFFNHCVEVSELAGIILEKNKNLFSKEEAELLKISAFLHDIKKNEIDNSILNSDQPPTPEQWEEIKKHPRRASAVIYPHNKPVAEMVDDHHKHQEVPYPDGEIGETGKMSRILAIIDSFHSMTNDRPYRKAISTIEECETKLKEKFNLPEDKIIIDALIEYQKNKNIKG